MKIALIAPIPPYKGGIAKYCYSLAKELEKRHELLLLSYDRQYPRLLFGNKSQLDETITKADIRKEFKEVSWLVDSLSPESWSVHVRYIAAFGADLVIIPWWVTYWAPMYLYFLRELKQREIPVVFLCINVFEHEDNFLKRAVTRFVLKRVERMIVHSEKEKEQILAFHPQATVVKHLLPLFEYPDSEPVPATATLDLLFFGFVRPYKGLDTLLKAVALLKERNIRLRVAGQFWKDKEGYQRMVGELGIGDKVEITDRYVPEGEMGRFFSEADVVVLPYKRSITSGVIATAYAYGKPVLATRVGGFHEVVLDGITGKLVEPDDPQQLADGIAWFIDNRATDFKENISKFTSRSMSWSSLVGVLQRLWYEAHSAGAWRP